MTNSEFLLNFLTRLCNELYEPNTGSNQVATPDNSKEDNIMDFVPILATKLKMSIPETQTMLQHLYEINPGACISLFAKEIAIFLDLKYPDHISESNAYFVLSLTDGCIHTCNTPIKNHQCVALFRTLDDAKYACKILKPMLKAVYGKQKNKKH